MQGQGHQVLDCVPGGEMLSSVLSEEELSGLGGVVRGKIEEFVGELGRKCHAAVTQRAQDKVAYGEFFSSGYLSTWESCEFREFFGES